MNKLTTVFTVLALGLGLAACDNQEQEATSEMPPEAQSPAVDRETPTQEESRPGSVPAEPLDPPAENPSEPPDPGTHGIHEGTVAPSDTETDTGSGDTEMMEAPITEPGAQDGGQQPEQTEPPAAPPSQP